MRIGRIKLWDRFVISNRDRGDESAYITRLRFIDTPWFGVFLHKMHRPDAQPMHHDHPWAFISLVLRGSYVESFIDPADHVVKVRRVRWFNRKGLADAHYIVRLTRVPTWTLVFVGRTRRKWGYWESVRLSSDHYVWQFTPWDQHPVHAPRGF